MRARWPDFFLVGAARSGTTALFRMLGQHPDVFTPRQKEPHYFALRGKRPHFLGPGVDRGINRKAISDTDAYLQLFSGARDHAAVGEGSVSYLYYPDVASRIRREVGAVKIIVALREPAQRAFSNYQFLRSTAREPLASFEAALEAEDTRIREGWEHIFFYRSLGFYHRQLERYEQAFGRENIHAVLYDELRSDPNGVMKGVFSFLGVDPSIPLFTDFEINVSGQPRSPSLARLLLRPSWLVRSLRYVIPRPARIPLETAVRKRLLRRSSPPLELLTVLNREYHDDLRSLEGLIGREVSSWLHLGA
jgi:hypothetical protein